MYIYIYIYIYVILYIRQASEARVQPPQVEASAAAPRLAAEPGPGFAERGLKGVPRNGGRERQAV